MYLQKNVDTEIKMKENFADKKARFSAVIDLFYGLVDKMSVPPKTLTLDFLTLSLRYRIFSFHFRYQIECVCLWCVFCQDISLLADDIALNLIKVSFS